MAARLVPVSFPSQLRWAGAQIRSRRCLWGPASGRFPSFVRALFRCPRRAGAAREADRAGRGAASGTQGETKPGQSPLPPPRCGFRFAPSTAPRRAPLKTCLAKPQLRSCASGCGRCSTCGPSASASSTGASRWGEPTAPPSGIPGRGLQSAARTRGLGGPQGLVRRARREHLAPLWVCSARGSECRPRPRRGGAAGSVPAPKCRCSWQGQRRRRPERGHLAPPRPAFLSGAVAAGTARPSAWDP